MPAAMPAPSPLSLCHDEVFACLHFANEDGVAHFLHITVSYERALLRRVTEALPWLSRGRGGSGSREHPTPHHTLYRESCQRGPSSRGHRVIVLLTARRRVGSRTTRERV